MSIDVFLYKNPLKHLHMLEGKSHVSLNNV